LGHAKRRIESERITVAQPMKFDLAEYLPYLINRVGMAMIVRFSDNALAHHGVTISMWRVLTVLAHAGPQRQIDVADLSGIDVSTLSRIITRLARTGFVTRERSTKSNREVTVRLTPKAQRLVQESLPVADELVRTAVTNMTAGEVKTLKRLLRGMYANLADPRNLSAVSQMLNLNVVPRHSSAEARNARRRPKAEHPDRS
jgi:MarR family transcriptional regulator, organic hydroperoxide resistance regulator